MPKLRSRGAHARSVSSDPISGHDTGESFRSSLVPFQLDTFRGDDGEDLEVGCSMFMLSRIWNVGHQLTVYNTPLSRLLDALVPSSALFLSTATAEGATWDRFKGFCAISLVQKNLHVILRAS